MMGDKVAAREVATKAGVPTVPGSDGRIDDPAAARAIVERIGFPVMIKAAAGGGGRGIRVARDIGGVRTPVPAGERRGARRLRRRRPLSRAADRARAPHRGAGARRRRRRRSTASSANARCSGAGRRSGRRRRRRRLTRGLREKLCASAVALARSVGYRGAGTLEYLYDDADEEFFFLEMNTRIQVEHPVTEWITGIDLVGEMLRIAGGEKLRLKQADIKSRGHSIEVRICAEDPANGFQAVAGRRRRHARSGRAGRALRFDALFRLRDPAVLRFAARQADRLGRGSRARHRAVEARAPRDGGRRPEDDEAALHGARRRRRPYRGERPHRLARRLARDQRRQGWSDQGKGSAWAYATHSAATSTSSSRSTRRCRCRRSSRACR